MVEKIDPSTIEDEGVRQIVIDLMNVVETLSAQVSELTAENQRLRDENNRRVWGTGQAEDLAKQTDNRSVIGKRTSAVQASKHAKQTRSHPARSG